MMVFRSLMESIFRLVGMSSDEHIKILVIFFLENTLNSCVDNDVSFMDSIS